MRQRKRQSGFGTVQIVLIVFVIAVLGVTGLVVYQHHKSSTKNAAAISGTQPSGQQTGTTSTQPQPITHQNIVKIPELGISITVPDSIKDLTYQTTTVKLINGNQATLAKFSTTSLTAASASCGPSSMVLGTLEQASGQYPTQSQDNTNVLDYGTLFKQFPTFYISGSIAHAGICPTGTTSPAAATSDAHDFSSSFSTIQSLN